MAPKISCSFVSILVLFLAIQPFTIHSRSLKSTDPSLTSFQKGLHKQGIKEVKRYLKAFGYLDYEEDENHVALMDNKFDKTLESALKSYPKFYHLKVTGKLDVDNMKQMSASRYGVPDFVHPWHAERNASTHSKLHMIARHKFFPNMPKWPPPQTHLNYAFGSIPGAIPLEKLREVCSRAFKRWADVTAFTFSETWTGGSADIVIGFYRGDLGDGNPFDGPSNVLAHAFSPTDGRFCYDVDEQWSTPDQNAVMYAITNPGALKRDLRQDYIDGIRALYAGK